MTTPPPPLFIGTPHREMRFKTQHHPKVSVVGIRFALTGVFGMHEKKVVAQYRTEPGQGQKPNDKMLLWFDHDGQYVKVKDVKDVWKERVTPGNGGE